mgnify:CR=1 FL=1
MTVPARKITLKDRPSWLPEETAGRLGAADGYRFRFRKAERTVYRRRRRIPVSEWAERHRVITRGPFEGARYRNDITPHLAGILDASFSPSVQAVIICAAPQTGKSTVGDTCVGYAVDRSPGPVMWVYPDEDTATENLQDRILPMFRKSPRLRSYLTGARDDETAKRIKLRHMELYLGWARSAAKLGNKSIKYLVLDEIDKYPEVSNKRESSPVNLAEARGIWYEQLGGKRWKFSTPTVETGEIWQALTVEAQVVFDYWPRCPACGKHHPFQFESIRWPEDVRDPKVVEEEGLAWAECPECGDQWDDDRRNLACLHGQWRAQDEEHTELFRYLKQNRPRKIGFHMPSWISRMVPLVTVAASFLRGQLGKNALKDFKNKHAAEPWLDYTVERREDRILALRDDRPRGIVPSGGVVAALTAGVDTQEDGFYFRIDAWGWGMLKEAWLIREGYVRSFEALETVLLEDRYPAEDGSEYRVLLALQDAMGHRTSEVYDFCRRHRRRIIPLQGVDTRRMTQPHAWSNIEYYPKTKKPIPGGLKLLRVDVNFYKDELAGKLEVNPEDPGAWHLHAETPEELARHMCAEVVDEKGLWVPRANRPNHYWDCTVYNLAAWEVLGVRYMRPPQEKKEPPRDQEQKPSGGWLPQGKKGAWLR